MNTTKEKTAQEIKAGIARVAPSILLQTIWEHDNDADDSFFADNGQNADDFTPWQSEVRAMAIIDGSEVSGSDYLGGTWEEFGNHPATSNPDISGYYPQMVDEALRELAKQLPEGSEELAQAKKALIYLNK